MVKLNGPLMSMAASGTIGDAVTFSQAKGRAYARRRSIPADPQSGAQIGRRAMFKWLTENWTNLSAADKATWQDLADQNQSSTITAYMQHNLQRWHNFLMPTQAYPAAEVGTPATSDLNAAAWEENRVKLTQQNVAVNDGWGMAIFASTSTPLTPTVALMKLAVIDQSATGTDVFWTPPTRTTWYFRSRNFTIDGVMGPLGSQQTAAP